MTANLADLSPDVAALANQLVSQAALQGIGLSVVSTRRTCADQNAKYEEGRTAPGPIVTNARGCQSWHVVGRAFDVDIVRGPKDWQTVGAIGKSLGLVWGGDFGGASAVLKDYGHFEYHPGLTIADVCPNPDACTGGRAVPLPASGVVEAESDWMDTCCSSSASACGPRVRLLSSGQAELEGLGTPSYPTPSWAEQYRAAYYRAARKHGVPTNLLVAFSCVESMRGNPRSCSGDPKVTGAKNLVCPEGASCPCVAFGLMQLTRSVPAARNLTPVELFDVDTNLDIAAGYVRGLFDRYRGNIVKMGFAYNAGGVYCGPAHETYSGERVECADNVYHMVANCRCSSSGCTAVDYGGDLLRYLNGAAAAWGPSGEPAPVPPLPIPAPPLPSGIAARAGGSPMLPIVFIGAGVAVGIGVLAAMSEAS
jgi:hypothetical protein